MASTALTKSEHAELIEHEAAIESSKSSIGARLKKIRDKKLYRAAHKTFEVYLDERWGISRSRGYGLIDVADVTENLRINGKADTEQSSVQNVLKSGQKTIEPNASQATELAKAPPEEQAEVWEEVVETTAKPTAAAIKGVVEQRKKAKEATPEPEPMPTMSDDEKLARQAIAGAQPGRELLATIRGAMKQLKALEPDRGLEMIVSRRQSIHASLQTAANAVNVYLPADVCPRCSGKGCAQCGNFGWVNKIAKQQLEK